MRFHGVFLGFGLGLLLLCSVYFLLGYFFAWNIKKAGINYLTLSWLVAVLILLVIRLGEGYFSKVVLYESA